MINSNSLNSNRVPYFLRPQPPIHFTIEPFVTHRKQRNSAAEKEAISSNRQFHRYYGDMKQTADAIKDANVINSNKVNNV